MKVNYDKTMLSYVWKAIDQDKNTLRSVALELECGVDEVNRMYIAAKKLFYKKEPKKQPEKTLQKTIKRPPANYSNKSPYGIARPGNNLSLF